jgi:N-carbamoylputrescine amidase
VSQTVHVAALQAAFSSDLDANVARVTELCREAAGRGAQVILPSELFEGPYFPREQRDVYFALARPLERHPTIAHFRALASELGAVIPVSFFERAGQAYFNSVAVIDADGALLGTYRKSHIPDGPGYTEKFYFNPGDTGFKAWMTRHGVLGVGICWDQWFPECARAMALKGADLLLYPTAIGSEPHAPALDTRPLWQRAMLGHAVCNMAAVIAANRVGDEGGQRFYGYSFITDHTGEKLAELPGPAEGVIDAVLDLEAMRRERAGFGFFRDRRPDLYRVLLSADGAEHRSR